MTKNLSVQSAQKHGTIFKSYKSQNFCRFLRSITNFANSGALNGKTKSTMNLNHNDK